MIKLIKLLEELKPPSPDKIYIDKGEDNDYGNLTPQQRKNLLSQGSILVTVTDPNRPDVTSASKSISLPKIQDIQRLLKKYNRDLQIFKYSDSENVRVLSEDSISKINSLIKTLDMLDKQLKLSKK
jgi:hypothetical protein